MARIKRLKITSKVKTIDDLLTRSDINEILERVIKTKVDITDMVIIYKKSDNSIGYESTDSTSTNVVGLIEFVKNMILNPLDDE